MNRWRIAAVAAATTTALVGIGACTSTSGGGSAAAGVAAGVAAVPQAKPSAAGSAAGSAARASERSGAGQTVSDLSLSTAKIRTAELSVTIRHGTSVAGQADSAEKIVTAVGGEVDADERTSGRHASATLILRVPPEQLANVLTALSGLGIEHSRHLTTEDVTAKVADVTSRVASAREAIARLRSLYSSATKVADVISVESELSGRESDLESLEAQQRSLAAQTATATITLDLSAQVVAPPVIHATTHHRSGFLGGLQNGWDAFTGGASAVATGAGAIVPFAVLLAIVLIGLRLIWPRLRPAAPTPGE